MQALADKECLYTHICKPLQVGMGENAALPNDDAVLWYSRRQPLRGLERRLEAVPPARYDAQCQALIESANGDDDLPTL